jgi:hypothetical protein
LKNEPNFEFRLIFQFVNNYTNILANTFS